ncbi:hypothetical protein QQZ08_010032 [Neonectria magnoliae]|uniref:Uncharacterized protein n=1 Tax=Neonectria magnoliae TaxID=2732573 RepID=A0ABR1HJB4_9HYPO
MDNDGYCPDADTPGNMSDSQQNNTLFSSNRRAKLISVFTLPPSERKIDVIDRRLDEVTQLLQSLNTGLLDAGARPFRTTPSEENKTKPLVPTESSRPFGRVFESASDSPVNDGESSLAAHSVFANEFFQKAARTGSVQNSSLEMREILDSLQHIVDSLKRQTTATTMSYPNAKKTTHISLRNYEVPPIRKAVAILCAAKGESGST